MTKASIDIKNLDLRFWLYQGQSSGLKELVMNRLSPPAWRKKLPASKKEFWGLKNINLEIKEGDRLGIIGHNGAGKSSLLKVISRIYRPTNGTISVQGRISPLLEIGAGFNPELSGRENIYLNSAILGIKRKVIHNHIQSIIDFAQLEEFIDMPVKYYSTGMYLRLAFSVATEIPPDILILDELYAGGDATFVERANQRLKSFISSSKVLILVAHNLDYIEQLCNRVIVLDHGTIVYEGTPKEAIRRYLAHTRGESNSFTV